MSGNELILIELYQIIRKKMVDSAKESIKEQASNSEIYSKMQTVFVNIDSSPIVSYLPKSLACNFCEL